MSEGIENVKYVLLRQEVDQLEWCIPMLPFPNRCIGIPCLPCDLANNFFLFESNETFSEPGAKILDISEKSTVKDRACIPSLRRFSLTSRNFYNQEIITAERPLKIPFFRFNRPEITINYQGVYAGKIVDPCTFQLCKGQLIELDVYDKSNQIIYKIDGSIDQGGLCCLLPCQGFNEFKFRIKDITGEEVGFIKHMHFGLYNEFCSRADQYGIKFPDDAEEVEKYLLTIVGVFIDYLLFENT